MLAGLEDDGFCKTPIRQNSQSQSFSGAGSYRCNSDEEEAGPELEKEEAELSFLMSQQWDNEPEKFSLIRQVISACLNGNLSLYTLNYFMILMVRLWCTQLKKLQAESLKSCSEVHSSSSLWVKVRGHSAIAIND